jgi:hypothetical protein
MIVSTMGLACSSMRMRGAIGMPEPIAESRRSPGLDAESAHMVNGRIAEMAIHPRQACGG